MHKKIGKPAVSVLGTKGSDEVSAKICKLSYMCPKPVHDLRFGCGYVDCRNGLKASASCFSRDMCPYLLSSLAASLIPATVVCSLGLQRSNTHVPPPSMLFYLRALPLCTCRWRRC